MPFVLHRLFENKVVLALWVLALLLHSEKKLQCILFIIIVLARIYLLYIYTPLVIILRREKSSWPEFDLCFFNLILPPIRLIGLILQITSIKKDIFKCQIAHQCYMHDPLTRSFIG